MANPARLNGSGIWLTTRPRRQKLTAARQRPGRPPPGHLIRRLRQVIQYRLLPSVRWADIPQPSSRDRSCPAAWQQYWQQSRQPSMYSAASGAHYPSSEGLARRLVVTMREQQGDTSQYGGTGEILT